MNKLIVTDGIEIFPNYNFVSGYVPSATAHYHLKKVIFSINLIEFLPQLATYLNCCRIRWENSTFSRSMWYTITIVIERERFSVFSLNSEQFGLVGCNSIGLWKKKIQKFLHIINVLRVMVWCTPLEQSYYYLAAYALRKRNVLESSKK